MLGKTLSLINCKLKSKRRQKRGFLNCHISPVGVDYCDSVTMYFKDKRVAQLNVHQESTLNNYAVISGDKGLIEVSIQA